MKNVTATLDEEVAQWVRIWAAQNNTSVSQLLGGVLRNRMLEEEGHNAAMQQFLERPATKLKKAGETYPDRDSLHER